MDKERRYGLSRITVIAAVGFILMAILLAMGEILDIPYVVFNAPPTPINWHELSIELLYIAIVGVFVLLSIHRLDISRMKAEEKIKESEKEWRESFNSIADMMIITDGDYNIINVNRAVEDRLKKPKEEIIGRKCYKIIHGREEPCDPCPMQESMRTKQPVTRERYHSNLDIYTSIKVSPVLDENGEINTFVHIIADITDLKKAEQKLDAEKRYSRGLFEASLDPLVTFDENGVITDVNEATVKATGCGRDELIGTSFSEYFTDPEKAQEGVNLVFKKGAVTDHELTMKSKTGEEIIVSYNATVFHDEKGEMVGVFAAARDITERKKIEEAMHKKEVESMHMSRLSTLGEMATAMAHEINQPLTIISAAAEGVSRDIKKDRLDLSLLPRDLGDILNNVKRIDRIITHMRTFAQRSEEWEYIKPEKLLDNTFTLLGEQLRVHDISTSREIEKNLPTIEVDPNQVEQVFINILTNARQVLDEKGEEARRKGREFSKQLVCKISREKDDVIFEFADNACDVPDEIKERVFYPFFTTKEVGQGTGMGLSIAYGIVTRSLNGKIRVEDNEMGGASFRVALPIERVTS